jgi:hypothetical protein
LAGVAGEFTDDERSGHGAVPNGCGESKHFLPLRSDQFEVEFAADQRSERWVVSLRAWHIEPLVGEVADSGREAEAQHMAERKDMIGEACGVGVVLLDSQIGLMVEQTVENVRGVAGIRGDHLGIKGRVLVGDVGIKEHTWLISIAQIDLSGLLSASAGAESLAIGG